ncbi:MAG TPA: hypothetical protein VFK48_01780 [Usitatibacter sp.]|nr:hypothetical protein [Usitatibacter sp.]
MRPIQRVISIGFATAAIASASMPALSWTVWPDVDFEWYANVGRTTAPSMEVFPAPREGHIWVPGRYEQTAVTQSYVPGYWIRDDYSQRVALDIAAGTTFATGPATLYDHQGNPIPTNPEAYAVDSARPQPIRR